MKGNSVKIDRNALKAAIAKAGTMAHWGIAKAIEIVEQTPDENAEMRESGTNISADLEDDLK